MYRRFKPTQFIIGSWISVCHPQLVVAPTVNLTVRGYHLVTHHGGGATTDKDLGPARNIILIALASPALLYPGAVVSSLQNECCTAAAERMMYPGRSLGRVAGRSRGGKG